jgi:hypothetical protein
VVEPGGRITVVPCCGGGGLLLLQLQADNTPIDASINASIEVRISNPP